MSMRTFTVAAAGVAAVLLMAPAAQAQYVPNGAQQACTPDAMRLCQDLISEGNHAKIKSCLIRKRFALSPECRVYFTGGKHHRHRRHYRS